MSFISKIKDNYALTGILLLASLLRFYHADFQSIWVDEINTMFQANPHLSLVETYDTLLNYDLQPPLYFYLLKYLFIVFGYTTLVMRLFSAVAGIAGIFAIYLLGRELVNRRAGLIASLLLCINYYHIHYSQEGRPYAFLVLFTTLSFYYLSVFLRTQTKKNAILLGLTSALMLYGHPIGMFALFSQFLVLSYSFLIAGEQRILFLKRWVLMGVVFILLYIPALPLLLSASGVKSFWIELPWEGIFTFILSQFFGASELVLAVVYLLMLFFFISVLRKKEQNNLPTAPLQRAFLILIPWIVCCILIPLIRSHLSVPMIIPRYMNIILPAVILVLAIGLEQVGNSAARVTLIVIFIFFSFTDLFVIKNYYHRPTKTDFRGITNYVIQHAQPEDQMVSRIGWHYSYMFENTTPKYPVLWNSFQAYVETAIKWPQNFRHGFWFVDAQAAPLTLTSEASAYLYDHYLIDYRKDLYQAVGIHYLYKDTSFLRLNFPTSPEISGQAGGSVNLTEDVVLASTEMTLAAGNYELLLSAGSQPGSHLNGFGSHISIKINGKLIGGAFLSENETTSLKTLRFYLPADNSCRFELLFDNGYQVGDVKRQAIVYAAHLKKTNSATKNSVVRE